MHLTASKLNSYILIKLPLAFVAGLRVKELDSKHCLVSVRHKWINQNPFKSMYWAVQGMAAELSIGSLLLHLIAIRDVKMSTLVVSNSAEYYKKARGKIVFNCNEYSKIESAIDQAILTTAPVIVEVNVNGINEEGVEVSSFNFSWSIKPKP